jgi:hypothetical protein
MNVPILEPKVEETDTANTDGLKNSKVTVVSETNIGVYLWLLPNGDFLSDDDANFLCIPTKRGDKKRSRQMKEAAAHYGYPEGEVYFYEGSRRVSDEEFWHQVDNIREGKVPDDYDIPALMGELEAKRSGLGY